MGDTDNPTSLTEIRQDIRDLREEIREDIRDLRTSFVSARTWEDWRRDNYAPRVEKIEDLLEKLDARIDGFREEINQRFRNNVYGVIRGLVYPLLVVVLTGYIVVEKASGG